MHQYIINNSLVDKDDANIHVSDLALLRGYGIFDFFRLEDSVPLFFEEHLDRFFRSASRLRLHIPAARDDLRALVLEMIRRNDIKNSGVRLVLTGGPSPDGYSIGHPTLIGMQEPLATPPEDQYTEGIKIIPCEYLRDIPDVKTLNYSMGIYKQPEIMSAGAADVLYHWDGRVSELSRSNVFIVSQSGSISTPNGPILRGITRSKIIALAREDFEVQERTLYLDEVLASKECFVTGTTKRVMPVVQIGNHRIGEGKVGQVTRRLQQLFSDYVREKACQ